MKSRKDRRSGMPLENPFVFYARYAASEIRNVSSMLWTYRQGSEVGLTPIAD